MKIIQKVSSAIGMLCLILISCNLSSLLVADPSNTTPSASVDKNLSNITGTVWHDLCALPLGSTLPDPLPIGCTPNGLGGARANGFWEADEPGIPDVTIVLYINDCNGTPLKSTTTDAKGIYSFSELSPQKYCILVDSLSSPNDKILTPGEWTSPASTSYFTIYTVDIINGVNTPPINFGWDYQLLPEYAPNANVNTPASASVAPATLSPAATLASVSTSVPTAASSTHDTTPPSIGEVTTVEADVYYGNAAACGSSGTITIEAYINDASGVASAYVKYRYISSSWDGDYHTVNYIYQAGTGLTGFTIPAGEAVFELGTDDGYIQYFVYATDLAGNTSVYPAGAIAPVAIPIYYCP